ncbi:hypothetical protein [Streptomyces mirabilis]|uniref:hypothetical protein n=1 Tax=Streptomyces mirabilis TaxID=68239 RepID=UPI0033A44F3E
MTDGANLQWAVDGLPGAARTLRSTRTGTLAGINRTGFYSKKSPNGTVREGPYQHLAEGFVRRLKALHEAGALPDPGMPRSPV